MKYGFITALLAITLSTSAHAQDQKEKLRNGLKNIEQMDANKDGTTTLAEIVAGRAQMFTRFDRNKDNQLTSDDIPTGMGLLGGNSMFENVKKTYDADKNGKVTRAEFVNGPSPAFDFADTNKDNQATAAERQAALAKLK